MSNYIDFFEMVARPPLISEEEYLLLQENVQKAIITHLKGYTAPGDQRKALTVDKNIRLICGQAARILEPAENSCDGLYSLSNIMVPYEKGSDDDVKNASMWSFKRDMISNIPIILSSENECIMQVLPFLLLCYTMTAYKNHIDPFGGDSNSTGYSWDLLTHPDKQNDQDMKARSTRRKQLGLYFFPGRVDELKRKSGKSIFCLDMEDYLEERKNRRVDINFGAIQQDGRIWIRDTELCRRFAAFLLACRKHQGVNMTLSFALFSSLFHWELGDQSKMEEWSKDDPERQRIVSLVKCNPNSQSGMDIYQYAGLCKWRLKHILENRDRSRDDAMMAHYLFGTNIDGVTE